MTASTSQHVMRKPETFSDEYRACRIAVPLLFLRASQWRSLVKRPNSSKFVDYE